MMKELPKSTPNEMPFSITSHLACSSHIHTPSSRIPPQTGFTPHHTSQSHWAVTPLLHHCYTTLECWSLGWAADQIGAQRASPGDRGTETRHQGTEELRLAVCGRRAKRQVTGCQTGDGRHSDRRQEAVGQEPGHCRRGGRRLSGRRQEAVGQETLRQEAVEQETGDCRRRNRRRPDRKLENRRQEATQITAHCLAPSCTAQVRSEPYSFPRHNTTLANSALTPAFYATAPQPSPVQTTLTNTVCHGR